MNERIEQQALDELRDTVGRETARMAVGYGVGLALVVVAGFRPELLAVTAPLAAVFGYIGESGRRRRRDALRREARYIAWLHFRDMPSTPLHGLAASQHPDWSTPSRER